MILNFFFSKSIIFFISILILQVNAETKIIGKNGDTLLKLSKEHEIPLRELMHKNDFNDANKKIEGEIIIIPLKNKNKLLTHKVIEGDTLYKISSDYNVNIKDIISINNLKNISLLQPNQILILPSGAKYNKEVNKKKKKLASRKVYYHQTSKAEDINNIAIIHKVLREEIIDLNQLNDSKKVNPNTKIKIRNTSTLKWLKYGSLIINWSDWTYIDGNFITEAKNKKNKPFYIAISCNKRVLNNTLKYSNWTSWYFPTHDFEFKLINDFCNHN